LPLTTAFFAPALGLGSLLVFRVVGLVEPLGELHLAQALLELALAAAVVPRLVVCELALAQPPLELGQPLLLPAGLLHLLLLLLGLLRALLQDLRSDTHTHTHNDTHTHTTHTQ
jgi:hypothetical protein